MLGRVSGLVLLTSLSGCAGTPVKQHPVHSGSHLVTTDAAYRVGYIHHKGDKTQFCFQPEPDADSSKEGGFSFGLSIINNGQGGGGSDHATVENEMGGRTAGVLFAREAFYRLCEMAISTGVDDEKWESLYLKTLDRVADVLKIEASNAKPESARAGPEALPTMDLPQGQRPPQNP